MACGQRVTHLSRVYLQYMRTISILLFVGPGPGVISEGSNLETIEGERISPRPAIFYYLYYFSNKFRRLLKPRPAETYCNIFYNQIIY